MADHGRVRAARSVTNLAPYPPNQPDPFELTLSAPRPTRWTATEGIGSSPPVRGVASRSTAEKRSKVVRSCQGCRPGFLPMCGDCPDHIPALGVATTNSPSQPPRAINADSFVARSACLSTNVKSWALPTAACRIRKVADIASVTALPPSPLRGRE